MKRLKFPGSKLLHNWDLSAQHLSLNDLLRSCQQIGLTGFAEVKTPSAVAMIFYYLGGEVNALYREGVDGLQRQRSRWSGCARRRRGIEGEVSVYELPLDMAHLLRGITNRQKLKETLKSKAELVELLAAWRRRSTPGRSRCRRPAGAAMVLLVNGRVSNIYWETTAGSDLREGRGAQPARGGARQARGDAVPVRVLARRLEEPPRGAGLGAQQAGGRGAAGGGGAHQRGGDPAPEGPRRADRGAAGGRAGLHVRPADRRRVRAQDRQERLRAARRPARRRRCPRSRATCASW